MYLQVLEYKINLDENKIMNYIHLAIKIKIKLKLQCIDDFQVIARVTKSTKQVNSMVVVDKHKSTSLSSEQVTQISLPNTIISPPERKLLGADQSPSSVRLFVCSFVNFFL